jgi:hypothetical protein
VAGSAGPGGLLHRELKTDAGMSPGRGISPSQRTWRDRLQAAGLDWGVWTPRDLATGRIESELAAIKRPKANATTHERFTLAMLGIPSAGTGEPAEIPSLAAVDPDD